MSMEDLSRVDARFRVHLRKIFNLSDGIGEPLIFVDWVLSVRLRPISLCLTCAVYVALSHYGYVVKNASMHVVLSPICRKAVGPETLME